MVFELNGGEGDSKLIQKLCKNDLKNFERVLSVINMQYEIIITVITANSP